MAITVNPPVQTNQVTGEPEAVPDSQLIDYTGTDVQSNTVVFDDSYDPAFDPEFQRTPQLNDPAFYSDDPQAQINFWRRSEPLTNDEVSRIQDVYMGNGNEQLPRLLAYKLTGDTDALMPDDFDVLGLNEAEINAESALLTPEEIDHQILTDADDPSPAKADAILRANIGNSNAATVVQHLAHQYYSGQITAQEALFKAGTSGVDQGQIYKAFALLGEACGGQWARRPASY